MVSRAQTLRRDHRDRFLSAREPQPDSLRRAQASGRKHELATLLVRQILKWKHERGTARCEVKGLATRLAGSSPPLNGPTDFPGLPLAIFTAKPFG